MLWCCQCCDPGCFIPDPGSDHCSIPDPDPGSGSRIRGVEKHRIPDPGGKKTPDPGSGSATLGVAFFGKIVDV
jgi:hypothetical protein